MTSPQTPNANGMTYVDFDHHDEETLALCCQRVSDDLSDRFAELLLVGEQFCGTAINVPGGRSELDAQLFGTASKHHYDAPTTASKNFHAQRNADFTEKFNASAAKKRLDMSVLDSAPRHGLGRTEGSARSPEDLRMEFNKFKDL